MFSAAGDQAEGLRRLLGVRQARPGRSMLLIDARWGHAARIPAAAAEELVVLVRPTAASITDAYAFIKRVRGCHACPVFSILVSRAPDEVAALRVFDNLARTAQEHLGVALQFMGYVRGDRMPMARNLSAKAVPGAAASVPDHYSQRTAERRRLVFAGAGA